MEMYKAYSTKAASCIKAKEQNAKEEDILKAGSWTNTRTFGKFYNKSKANSTFAEAVLKL